MKNIGLIVITVMIFALSMFGCSRMANNPFLGDWYFVTGDKIDIKKDNTYSSTKRGNGVYTVDGNTITLKNTDPLGGSKITFEFVVDGDIKSLQNTQLGKAYYETEKIAIEELAKKVGKDKIDAAAAAVRDLEDLKINILGTWKGSVIIEGYPSTLTFNEDGTYTGTMRELGEDNTEIVNTPFSGTYEIIDSTHLFLTKADDSLYFGEVYVELVKETYEIRVSGEWFRK